MWLVAFIALVGILLVFDRVAHADPAPVPAALPDLVDPDAVDPIVAATLDEADATDDDARAASELVRIDPAWLTELTAADDNAPTHTRPSRFGRLDLAVAWRHADRDPRTLDAYAADEVLVLATWRR